MVLPVLPVRQRLMGRGTMRSMVEGLRRRKGPSTALRAVPLPIGVADWED
jgi:hypothetical protein